MAVPKAPLLAEVPVQKAEETSAVSRFVDALMQAIDAGGVELPPMSPIAQHAARLRKAQEVPADLVRHVMECEPAAAGQAIRLASSACYPQVGGAVSNLRCAVDRLGCRTAVNLIETVAMGELPVHGRDVAFHLLRKVWTNTLFTAAAARELARWLGMPDPEDAYLAGMFHNVGEPLLIRVLAEQTQQDGLSFATDPTILQTIEAHHGRVGERLLRTWAFPEEVCRLAATHHDLPTSPLHALVVVAWHAALSYGYTYLDAHPDRRQIRAALDLLGLDADTLDVLPEHIGATLNQALAIIP